MRVEVGVIGQPVSTEYIDFHMKQILIELDERLARDLQHVAPTKKRMRAEFVRRAIRRAIDLALDQNTELAYCAAPLPDGCMEVDVTGWDQNNRLATPSRSSSSVRAKKVRGARSVSKARAA